MTRQYLDLVNDGFDQLEGRVIRINKIDYEIVEIIAIGGEKVVVALRNMNTGLVLLAARIFKAKFGTPLYESIKVSAINRGYLHRFRHDHLKDKEAPPAASYDDLFTDALLLSDVSSGLDLNLGNIILQKVPKRTNSVLDFIDNYEVYEFGGALIQLQHILNINDYPENQDDLMNQAAALFHARDFEKLEPLLEEILVSNPNHTEALLFKGSMLCLKGFWKEGVNQLQEIIALEPNIENYYLYLVDLLLSMGRTRYCLQVLAVGLNRYKLNMALYERMMAIINDWGFLDLFADYYNDYIEKLDPSYANYLVEQHTKSLEKFIKFREYFDEGVELQVKHKWAEVAEKMVLAMEATNGTCWGQYNLAVCNFHMGNFEKAIELLQREIFLPNLPELEASVLLLLGIANHVVERYDEATLIFEEIANRYTDIYDLPTLPIAFVFIEGRGMGTVQTKAFPAILQCIKELQSLNPGNKRLTSLLILYQECEKEYTKN